MLAAFARSYSGTADKMPRFGESRRGYDRDARILQIFAEKSSTEDNDGAKRAPEFGLNYGHASVNMRARNAQ